MRIPEMKMKKVICAYENMGYTFRQGKGSHVVMRKGSIVFSLPCNKKTLSKGVVRKILKATNETIESIVQNS